jgi:hypothetical protein
VVGSRRARPRPRTGNCGHMSRHSRTSALTRRRPTTVVARLVRSTSGRLRISSSSREFLACSRVFWRLCSRSYLPLRRTRLEIRHGGLRCDSHRNRTGGSCPGATAGGCRLESRDHRAQTFRRHLHQHWLHSDQDADRERLRGASGAPCCRVWRGPQRDGECRHEGGEGAQGCRYGRIARSCRAVLKDVEGMYGS